MSKQEKDKPTVTTDTVVQSTSLNLPDAKGAPVVTPETQKLEYRFKLAHCWHETEQVKVAVIRKLPTLAEIVEMHGGEMSFMAALNSVIKDDLIQPQLREAINVRFANQAMLKTDAEREAFKLKLATFCQEFVDNFKLNIPADYLIALERARQAKVQAMQSAIQDAMLASIKDETLREAFRKQLQDAQNQ